MRKWNKRIAVLAMGLLLASGPAGMGVQDYGMVAQAHSGRTDSSGGHRDTKNKSGLGPYHYHCGGYPAHLHENGVCPYGGTGTGAVQETAAASTSQPDTVKAVQQALKDKGYDCGEADGIAGSKTEEAVRKFQQDNGLTVDGVIGQEVKGALGIA